MIERRLDLQRRELYDRIQRERRKAVTDYLRDYRERRAGVDRRDQSQISRDNRLVSNWIETFTALRNA